MRVGCCISMFATEKDPTGAEWLKAAADAGYDYAEFSAARIAKLSDAELEEIIAKLKKANLPCYSCNGFVSGDIKLTGPTVNLQKVKEYLEIVMPRIARLGAKYIVFGSPGARSYPEGFSKNAAVEQLADFLRLCAKYCDQYKLFVAIEPLNRGETNIINNLTEGAELMDMVNHPRIRLLSDYYHYEIENETLEVLQSVCDRLVHAHFAEVENRSYPTEMKAKYREFFDVLVKSGFNGGCSIEARSKNIAEDIAHGARVLAEYR